MNWADLSGSEAPPRALRPAPARTGPPNRQPGEFITCPTCGTLHVRRHSVTPLISNWQCLDSESCPTWKEAPSAGSRGRAWLA